MPVTFKKFAFVFNVGALTSIFIHAIILAPLVFGFPQLTLKPEEPEAVEVELAPPEEKSKSEPRQKPPPPAPPPKPEPRKEAPAAQAKPKAPGVLRPVVKFAEKDAGSSKPINGDAKRDTKPPSPATSEAKPVKQVVPSPKAMPAQAMPPKADGVKTATAPDLPGVRMPAPVEPATPEKTRQARMQSPNEGDSATTATGDLPRAIRAGQLCATELRRKLNNSNPPYFPDLLPAYRLDQGNVLRVRRGAFRANAGWYNLEFRCEVDEAATEVVTLDFNIGDPVPRGEWTRRGFPSN